MKYWLMKAEPESRMVKGKDVKFSVADFETVKTTPWEGVRNAEAKNIMKSMAVGDQVLFYHSSCKVPGIAAFAEVTKEAYPDYTAWDPSHPYYDEKSDKEKPKWFMVDVTFKSRAAHFVPLSLLRRIAAEAPQPSPDITYIGEDGVKAIQGMALINRGRLSVQPVEEKTWDVIRMLAEKGGWDESSTKLTKAAKRKTDKQADEKPKPDALAGEKQDIEEVNTAPQTEAKPKPAKKRKVAEVDGIGEMAPLRRSARVKK